MAKTINDLIGATVLYYLEIYDYFQIVTDVGGVNV